MRIHGRSLRRIPFHHHGEPNSCCGSFPANPRLKTLRDWPLFHYPKHLAQCAPLATLRDARPFQGKAVGVIPNSMPKNDILSWLALLEPLLEAEFRAGLPSSKPISGQTLDKQSGGPIITEILSQARRQANLDLLTHLGLVEGRWKAMISLVETMLDYQGSDDAGQLELKALSTIQYPKHLRLSALTANKLDSAAHVDQEIVREQQQRNNQGKSQTSALQTLVGNKHLEWQTHTCYENKKCLGQIWQTLGNLILAATKEENHDKVIMPHVLQVIAALHRKEMIPDSIYVHAPNNDPSALQQPPVLPQYSTLMLSSLYDAVNTAPSPAPDPINQKEAPKVPQKPSGPQLAPELWVEFVLWCCIHGGYLTEGTNILKEMKKLQGNNRWSLLTWRSLVDSSDESWNDFLRKKLGHTLSGLGEGLGLLKPATPRRSVKKTVSAEVVAAFVDGLTIRASQSAAPLVPIRELLDQLNALKGIFDRDKLGMGVLTWNSILARLVESTNIDVEENPRVMEYALTSFEMSYGSEIRSDNDPVSSYIFDPSAIILGLYHRTMVAYVRSRNSPGAIRLLRHLESLTETNKRKSVNEFFTILRDWSSDPASVSHRERSHSESPFRGVNYPNYYPNIPLQTLASLIDLFVEFEALEVGRWMLYADELEGPMISESLYGHQKLAPSLIRFAATARDEHLLSKVIKAQTTQVGGQTLVALCESRLQQANWQGATDVLDLTKKYMLHEWTVQDLAIISRPLFQFINPLGKDVSDESRYQASDFLLKLLRGDFGQHLQANFRQLDTMVALLASTNEALRDLTSNLLIAGKDYRTDLRLETFEVLLEGVGKAYGSQSGQELWLNWCSNEKDHRIVPVVDASPRDRDTQSISERFSRSTDDAPADSVVFYGNVEKSLSGIRIIAHQALLERQKQNGLKFDLEYDSEVGVVIDSSDPGSAKLHPQLEWAVGVMRDEFGMLDQDIDEETRGYLSSTRGPIPTSGVDTERYESSLEVT